MLSNTVVVAQLVRASDCGSEGRGFESLLPPHFEFLRGGGLLRQFYCAFFVPQVAESSCIGLNKRFLDIFWVNTKGCGIG